MCVRNQIIIKKVSEDLYEGREVNFDALHLYTSRPPDFTATTLEEAIHKYYEYREKLERQGFYIECGLAFEGI